MMKVKMFDCDGVELQRGDFVQFVVDKTKVNWIYKKGSVFIITSWTDRSWVSNSGEYVVGFLSSKNGLRNYQNGVVSQEIRKVDYDMDKKKVIK